MTTNEIHEYWTPVDSFILKVVEAYGSLAMLGPRIQSPFDLIQSSDINDTARKFRFTRYLKNFYIQFLKRNNLMSFKIPTPRDMSEANPIDGRDSFVEADNLSDVSLMRHPPMIGHWMKESGLLLPEDMKLQKERTYAEYKILFDLRKGRNGTRKHLYPSFEGLLVTRSELAWSRDDGGRKCVFENLTSTIFALDENVIFNSSTGEFNIFEAQQIYGYGFSDDNEEDSGKPEPAETINTAYMTKDRSRDTPLSIFNDRTFTEADVDQGFFNTDIMYAYHMGFDLNASYEFTYPKECEVMPKGIRNRKYNTLSQNSRVTGRLIDERRKISASDCEVGDIGKKKINIKGVKEDNFMDSLDLVNRGSGTEKEKILKMWKSLPVIDNPKKILPSSSVYASYYDYYHYDNILSPIMSISKSNYFWFMYGALPINKIYYENLEDALDKNSFIGYDKDSKLNTADIQEIFVGNKGVLATEANKEEHVFIYRQAIKFLGLVWGLKNEDIKSFSDIPMYFSPTSGSNISSMNIKFEVLDSIYPKISSLNYVEPVKVIKPEAAPISEHQKTQAAIIISKLRNNTPLRIDDFDFMRNKEIFNDNEKMLYKDITDFNNATPDQLKKIIGNVDDKIAKLEAFVQKPIVNTDIIEFIPENLRALDSRIKFTVDKAITDNEKDVIQQIKDYLLDESNPPKYIPNDMIMYLYSWGVIQDNFYSVFKPYYIVSDKGPPGLGAGVTYNYLKGEDAEKIPQYQELKEELKNWRVMDKTYIKSREVTGKDRKATLERPRDDKKDKNKNPQQQQQGGGGKPQQGSGGSKPQQQQQGNGAKPQQGQLTKAQRKALRKTNRNGKKTS